MTPNEKVIAVFIIILFIIDIYHIIRINSLEKFRLNVYTLVGNIAKDLKEWNDSLKEDTHS